MIGGGGGALSMGIRVYLKDNFSGPVRNMKSALKEYRSEFSQFQENLRVGRNLALGMAAVGTALTAGMSEAVSVGADFLYIMQGVAAISEAANDELLALENTAIRIGRETMFFPKDIASGMRFMAMAGQDAQTILQTIDAATNLAGASMTVLGGKMGSADILTNALKAFGWEAKRSAEMSDVLVSAVTNANVSLIDVGNSIRYVAATTRNLNVPVQETIGMLMALGNAGIQSSMAGTALENAYRYLANSLSKFASKRATEAWSTLGISKDAITDAKGNLLPLTGILTMINDQLKGMNAYEKQNILRDIFGVRGQRAAATLMRNLAQAKGFATMLGDPNQIGGTAAKKMNMMMDTMQGAIWRVQSALQGLKVAFTKAVEGPLRVLYPVLEKLIAALTTFTSSKVGKVLVGMAAGFVALATPVLILRAAFASLALAMKSLVVLNTPVMGSIKTIGTMMFATAAQSRATAHAVHAQRMASYSRYGAGYGAPHRTSMIVGGGMMQRPTKGGPRYAGKASSLKVNRSLVQIASNTGKSAGFLRGLGGVMGGLGRGLLGMFGGIGGIATMAAFIGIPMLIDAFSSNTDATRANTAALKENQEPVGSSQYYALLRGQTMEDILKTISDNLYAAVDQGLINHEEFMGILQSDKASDILPYSLGVSGNPVSYSIPE